MLWFLAFLITAYWIDPLPWVDEIALALLLIWFRFDLAVVAALLIGGLWWLGNVQPSGLLIHPYPSW